MTVLVENSDAEMAALLYVKWLMENTKDEDGYKLTQKQAAETFNVTTKALRKEYQKMLRGPRY